MSRISVHARIIETNDEIMELPGDDCEPEPDSYAAFLLALEDLRIMSSIPIDKESYEWKEYSRHFDNICRGVDKEYKKTHKNSKANGFRPR